MKFLIDKVGTTKVCTHHEDDETKRKQIKYVQYLF